MDFTKYFSRKIYTTEAWKMSLKNHIIFWSTKVGYLVFYMILPIIVWGFGPWLIGFLLLHVVMGLTLSLVFQLAHVVENTEFENVALDETKHIETAWAEHQIKTSSNFSMNNRVISVLSSDAYAEILVKHPSISRTLVGIWVAIKCKISSEIWML